MKKSLSSAKLNDSIIDTLNDELGTSKGLLIHELMNRGFTHEQLLDLDDHLSHVMRVNSVRVVEPAAHIVREGSLTLYARSEEYVLERKQSSSSYRLLGYLGNRISKLTKRRII